MKDETDCTPFYMTVYSFPPTRLTEQPELVYADKLHANSWLDAACRVPHRIQR
jgi:hypothetical protein